MKDLVDKIKKEDHKNLREMLCNDLLSQIRSIVEENTNMKFFINYCDAISCSKCGAYHMKHHVCYNCGFDRTS